jgi:hypothetical protein
MYMELEDGAVEVLKVMDVDEDSIQARMEEDVVYVEPEEGAMEVMMMEDKTAVSLEACRGHGGKCGGVRESG